MPTNYSGRLTLILAVVLLALFAIFPPKSLIDPNLTFTQKLNLKPGIDMVGGTSLLYEIKPPEGAFNTSNLAVQTMEALKRRVDPDGVRNLIWRPQGSTRLEIQMPLSAKSEKAGAIRHDYNAAREQLMSTNVRVVEVINTVEKLSGDVQSQRLKQLEDGSDTRGKLFGALRSTYDQIQQARAKGNVAAQAEGDVLYEQLKSQIEPTNLSVDELESILSAKPETREKKIAELKAKAVDFPARIAAIEHFQKAYDAFQSVKGAIDDAGELKRLLKGSGVLEFHILVTDLSTSEAQDMIQRLKQKGPGTEALDKMKWFQVERPNEFSYQTQVYNDKHWALAFTTPEKSMDNRSGRNKWALDSAFPTSSDMGTQVVGFKFDAQGGKYFSDLTSSNIGKPLAIMLDDKIISAPNIRSAIAGQGIIEGGEKGYSPDELRYLISTLNAGSLPAQLADEPISERTVEAQLGADNLRAGLMASTYGLVIVAVFLIIYYFTAGIVATFAVLLNVVLILGTMAAFNATFTLPGIAGMVLTVGAAVDANVLIFERLREEQHRGLSLKMAIRNAYDQAFSAILDSNVTTIITALVLYVLGSEEVKGFGLTLLIGLIWSLFTALFVTKTIFGIMVDKFGVDHLGSLPLTFPRWDRALKPNVNWIKLSWIFISFSVIFTILGLSAFVYYARQGRVMDIEFVGGTAIEFELKAATPKAEVENLLKDLKDASVLKMGNQQLEYSVVSPDTDAAKVRQTVLDKLGDKLKLERPSKFDQVGESMEQVVNNTILPVENISLSIDGWTPRSVTEHVGGAAIVLRHLDPPLKPSEIKSRIERQRLQPQADSNVGKYRAFSVENDRGNDEASTTAVVLVSDEANPYAQDSVKWRDELARPMWTLVNDAINNPPKLQKVSNFGPQVAKDTTIDALLALLLSFAVIMAYIWLRFGNLLFGTATLVAMFHDALLVIGAVGLSHYLADSAIGHALLIDPFRINLTVVAAVLTVMSYSMIDTIVVFDRIRENRGKFGFITSGIINDSINQTLSRTLLTGTTNIFTVLVMYVAGGPGIHGFTFVLLIGILVGTYSSVAIASPMLLIGGKREAETAARPVGGVSKARA